LTSGWTDIRIHPSRRLFCCRAVCLVCLLLCGISIAAQEPAPDAAKSIRVDVERVNVGVIVTDAKGNFVEGLQREDFQILEGATLQPVTDFAPVDAPAQVLLLLEAGPAVYLLQDSHLFVANALLNGLSAGDRVAIAVYNEMPTPLVDYTADKRAVENALDSIRFNLGYGNLNLAKSLNTVLDWLARVPGKKSIVLISTGVDTSPEENMQALIPHLETGDVRIFAVSMSGPLRNGKKGTTQQILQTQEAFAQADAWLKALADASGGRAYFPESARAFEETYRQVAQLVRHEYSLAFAPPKADGAVHAIDVKVTSSADKEKNSAQDYQVDHRRGYVAPKPPL
jgi:Ca-activated chloride channel family protein